MWGDGYRAYSSAHRIKISAIRNPIPEPPPVIKATLSLRKKNKHPWAPRIPGPTLQVPPVPRPAAPGAWSPRSRSRGSSRLRPHRSRSGQKRWWYSGRQSSSITSGGGWAMALGAEPGRRGQKGPALNQITSLHLRSGTLVTGSTRVMLPLDIRPAHGSRGPAHRCRPDHRGPDPSQDARLTATTTAPRSS